MSLEIGQVLDGKYRIVRLLGQGAMGAVFEGENVRIKRRVAIKVLHASVAARKELVDRFEREAQAAGRIGSEHIVEVLDLGELPDGSRYLVMEFLEGESLGDRIKNVGRIIPRQLMPMVRQLLVGLGAAHKAGIVHRDLKPDNVYLAKEVAGHRDFVKIVDFGVSKFSPLNDEEARMTQTGAVMGTPYYMSPEQAKGARDIDGRSDIFAVGVIVYEAVTGQVPFDGETFNELMFKIALQDPPPPEQIVPGLDPAIGNMIRKALAREVGQRFQSAEAFVAAIDEWLSSGKANISVPPPENVALKHSPGQRPHGSTQAEWAQSNSASVAQPPKKSAAGIFVGLGLAALVLGGGVAFYVTRTPATASTSKSSGEATTTAASTATAAPTANATTAATTTTTNSAETATPPASAEPQASASSATTSVAANDPPKVGKAGTPKPTATAKADPPPTATAVKPPPTATGRRPREDL